MDNSEPRRTAVKRKHSVISTNDIVQKRLHKDLQNSSDEFDETNQYRIVPHSLISLMYRIDLSILCSLRKCIYRHKYPSLSLSFGDTEINKFNDIVLCYKNKSIHVHIENVEKYYVNNNITYATLFTKEKERRSFFINDYFEDFIKYLTLKLDSSLHNLENLVIYTNSGLDLTEEKKLKPGRSRNFFPFKFDNVSVEKCEILKDFLFTNNKMREHDFYQFSQDKTTREEFLRRLQFPSAMERVIKERKFFQSSEREIKETFLDKLVLAVNQPSREELNSIIKSEIDENIEVQDDYISLQQRILSNLTAPEKHKKLRNYVSKIMYEFTLLMSFLHDMFLHKNLSFINFETKSYDTSSNIIVNYKHRIIYISVYNAVGDVDFGKLFPTREREKENMFSVNKHFGLFIEGLKNDLRYFVIYTNAGLNLTEEGRFKKGKSKYFYPLKFNGINIQKKRYKVLRDCSCINENCLYQFEQEQMTMEKVLGLLKPPSSLQKEEEEERLSDVNIEEIKEKFLNRLIFAVNQFGKEELDSAIRNEISKSNVPYNYEELCEVALRWSESQKFGYITKRIMVKLLNDIRNNCSSYQTIQNVDINEEINFAKSVVGRKGTPSFHQFLGFLIKGEGKIYLEVLKRNKIHLANMSSILNRSGNNAVKAFEGLYNLWFDEKKNKTQYLQTLDKEGINLASMSSILNGAGNNAVKAFKRLYDLWFDEKGNKTQYLKTLEKGGINLTGMSSILNGTGSNASIAYRDLYDLWFDDKGNKTEYLKSLENEGINLASMSSILNGTGINASTAFKHLYDLWFDEKGNKTQYLKTLEKEGINLANVSSILSGAGVKAPKAFKDLYDLWFDAEGNKTQCLKTLEEEGVNLANMSSILSRAAANAATAFKGLYDLWFDSEGNKTQYLKILEKEGMNIVNISSILHGAAANAVKAFEELYNTFFDEQGNKKLHLMHFIGEKDEKQSFMLNNLSSILNGAGANPRDAFEKLHSVCFNSDGTKTKFLDDFYKADFKASHLSCMLCGAGVHASSILEKLHNIFFTDNGEKTKLLDDLYKVGFTPGDLCNMLSGAVDSLEKFHRFCFVEETKKYLNRFLNDKNGFTLSGLSSILHGARTNICSALKDFYSVCFDEIGNKTQILDDFYIAGFTPNDLSHILSMAGNNAAFVLRNFHKSCFHKKNYLNHFLAQKKLFTPKDLSKILHGIGINISPAFKKLHNLCFDKTGNKTKYLKNLIKNYHHKMFDILYQKVRKGPT
ncbi:uncharacterized protein LOC105662430 [Megachile rotundata]|uniref:uncharacterized protein LOC105662430 n=1 Tax=Megachile rotundata TaxID=143995 RepID=UPI000614CD6D|nr:PREDICTED: uncharacterized protein LOC105662430 [Megachile rotundata]